MRMTLMALKRTHMRPVLRCAVLIALLAIASRASVYHTRHDAPFYESLGSNGHYFLPGIALAAVEATWAYRLAGRRWVRPPAVMLSLAGFATLLLSLWLRVRIAFPWEELVGDAGAAALVGGALVMQWSGGGCWRGLDNRALNWIGARSYPLFLVHTIVLDKLASPLHIGGYNVTLLILAPVALAVSLVCSALLHRWVELPALALKRAGRDARAARVAVSPGGGPAGGSTAQ
jgi:peptidoglycan/LPS O-acetylase OafA/YrhL